MATKRTTEGGREKAEGRWGSRRSAEVTRWREIEPTTIPRGMIHESRAGGGGDGRQPGDWQGDRRRAGEAGAVGGGELQGRRGGGGSGEARGGRAGGGAGGGDPGGRCGSG